MCLQITFLLCRFFLFEKEITKKRVGFFLTVVFFYFDESEDDLGNVNNVNVKNGFFFFISGFCVAITDYKFFSLFS
jgi:hypothetical protein